MPVGTNATIKALHPDEVAAAGASIVLANTYHLYLRPGHERIRAPRRAPRVHGLGPADPHRLGRLPGRVARRPAGDRRRRGRRSSRHLDGSIHRFTPEHSIAVQEALGPDIAVAFDQPVFPSSPRAVVREAMRPDPPLGRAVARRPHAHRPGAVRDRPGRARPGHARGVGAVHRVAAVRRHQHRRARRRRDAGAAQRDARRHGPAPRRRRARSRYLMGLGSPLDLLDAVHRGIDLFDSVLPARVARNGQLWVPGGRLNLRNAQYPGRSATGPGGLSVPALHPVLEGLSGPSVPGQGDARVPARDLSQPHLHPRLHAPESGPRSAPEPSPSELPELRARAVRMSGGEGAAKPA